MRLDGARRIAQLELVDAGHPQERRPLHAAVGGALERARVRVDHVVPRAGRPGEPLALLESAVPPRVLDQRLGPPVQRLGLIVQPGLGQLGEPLEHALAIRAGELLQLHLEDAVQLLVLARRLVQRLEHGADLHLEVAGVEHALEGAQRLLVGRVLLEDVAVDLDRALLVVELDLQRLAEPELQREHRRGIAAVGEHDLAAQHLGELGPRPGLRVQPIEREHGRPVVDLDLEDLAERRDRLRDVGSAPPRRRARAALSRSTCRGTSSDFVALGLVQLGELDRSWR